MFYQNHSLVLHVVEIFCNLDSKNLRLPYWAQINFMIHSSWTRKILELPHWAHYSLLVTFTSIVCYERKI